MLTFAQHLEMGRRPCQPAYPGKVERESECGSSGSNQAGCASTLLETEGFLFSESVIDHGTIQAYLETHYLVHGDAPMTLQVAVPNPSLAELHKASRVDCSAFITASNPFSRAADDAINADRQAKLAQDLRDHGLTFIDGIGQHPSGSWPGEPSFFVLGLSLEAAKNLGIRHEQNAIIWCDPDAVPQLVLLR